MCRRTPILAAYAGVPDYCRMHATGTTNLGLPREDFLSPCPAIHAPTISQSMLDAVEAKIELNAR